MTDDELRRDAEATGARRFGYGDHDKDLAEAILALLDRIEAVRAIIDQWDSAEPNDEHVLDRIVRALDGTP